MKRYFLHLSYDGTNYHGWQVQPNGNSIQAEINRAVSILCGVETEVTGAGRTDAGVHARQMVAHFDTEKEFSDPTDAVYKLNRMLPQDISILSLQEVSADMHARFSATSRTYRYYIHTARDPFLRHYSWRIPFTLDVNLMNEAASHLLHYTDFTSFSKLHTDVKTNDCTITRAEWITTDDTLVFTITANRFLRNMVRAIVGTLVDVGRGQLSVDDFCNIIERRNRQDAGMSVPANALFLEEITY